MGWWSSIFNPIHDIENVVSGLGNLITNPGKQYAEYIRPAVEEAAPLAAAAGMTILSAGSMLPEAGALVLGSYGSQIASKGLGNLTSGGVMSIPNALTGIAAATGVYGLQALGAGALGAGITGPGGSILSGAGTAFGNVGAGLGVVGSGIESGTGAIGSGLSTAGHILGTAAEIGGAGLGLETAYSAYERNKAMQSQSTNASGYTAAQIQQMFQQLMSASSSQLMQITNWESLLPLFSTQQQLQIGSLFTAQMVAELMAEAQDGSITTADYNAIMSVIPQATQQAGSLIYEQSTGQSAPGTVATTGVQSYSPNMPVSTYTQPTVNSNGQIINPITGSPFQVSATSSSPSQNLPITNYLLMGGGIIVAGILLYKVVKG